MKSKFCVTIILLVMSGFLSAGPIPKDSPLVPQLKEMGYELDEVREGEKYTIANAPGIRMLVNVNEERTSFTRVLRRGKLDGNDEERFRELVNELNSNFTYQVAYGDGWVAFMIYDFSEYNVKTATKIIRMMEGVSDFFDESNEFYRLMIKGR